MNYLLKLAYLAFLPLYVCKTNIFASNQTIWDSIDNGHVRKTKRYIQLHTDHNNLRDEENRNLLQRSILTKNNDPIIRVLLQTGQYFPKEAVYWICISGNVQYIKSLRLPEECFNQVYPPNNTTPLHIASALGFSHIVHKLISIPTVEINAKANHDVTPLWLACQNGHLDVVTLLLNDPRINLFHNSDQNASALLISCAGAQDHFEIVEKILTHPTVNSAYVRQSTINKTPSTNTQVYNLTALMKAAMLGHKRSVELIIEFDRGSIQDKSSYNLTAYDYALAHKHYTICDIIEANILTSNETDILRKLTSEKQIQIDIHNKINNLQKNQKLKTFYHNLHRKIHQYLLGYMVLGTDVVKGTGGIFQSAADGINTIGNMISFPFSSIVTTIIAAGFEHLDEREKKQHINFVTSFATNTTDITPLSQTAALTITEMYEDEIKVLCIQSIEDLTDSILSCLTSYIISNLTNLSSTPEHSFSTYIQFAIDAYCNTDTNLLDKSIKYFTNKNLQTNDGKNIKDIDILRKKI